MRTVYHLPDNVFVTGLMGAGKDFVAGALVKYAGFTRLSFADALKEKAAAQLDISLEELAARKAEFRSLLQDIGKSEREADEGYWIKEWQRRREAIPGPVVCADVRYLNEALFAIGQGGLLVRVQVPEKLRIERVKARDGAFDPAWGQHSSETLIQMLPVHADISGELPEADIVTVVEAAYVELGRWTVESLSGVE